MGPTKILDFLMHSNFVSSQNLVTLNSTCTFHFSPFDSQAGVNKIELDFHKALNNQRSSALKEQSHHSSWTHHTDH